MPRVIHFEIHAEEPQRAVSFYESAFGWQFQRFGGPQDYWLIRTGPEEQPGIDGGLLKRMGPVDGQAVTAYVCTVDVPSVDEAASKVESIGGTVVMPKMAIPGVGWLVYCKDTESNIFGMMQEDSAAS
ncbi:MAG TPA: VOC family protein [Blastocatellia bacterium]|nr:VOC family protein [Blastocatellia bacterium]